MEIVVAILIYIAVIVSPGEYLQQEIDMFIDQHQVEIDHIQQDPAQMDVVHNEFLPQVEFVIIDADQEY